MMHNLFFAAVLLATAFPANAAHCHPGTRHRLCTTNGPSLNGADAAILSLANRGIIGNGIARNGMEGDGRLSTMKDGSPLNGTPTGLEPGTPIEVMLPEGSTESR